MDKFDTFMTILALIVIAYGLIINDWALSFMGLFVLLTNKFSDIENKISSKEDENDKNGM